MSTRLDELLSREEYARFLDAIRDTAKCFPDIIGVLGVGSLVHSSEIPDDFFTLRYNTARGLAYERIRNPGRRRLAIREESDLDIWICTKDTDASSSAQADVELGAVALLDELVSGTLDWGSVHWHNKKLSVFGRHYKRPELYLNSFLAANGGSDPWLALGFKGSLEARLIADLPDFVQKVNQRFVKKIPGDFLEIRAFPESLFHLRRKTLRAVTDADVETMYPLLKGRELQEAKDTLVGGDMVILIIEADLPAPELFQRINAIKGPRLIDRSFERLMEGRILDGSLRDLLPIPGEEESYKTILPTILAKKADAAVRFSDEDYKYYAQNLVHSPDNKIELRGLFQLTGFMPK